MLVASGPQSRFATPTPPPLEFGLDDAMLRRSLDQGRQAGKRTALAGLVWAAAVVVVVSRFLYETGGLELRPSLPEELPPIAVPQHAAPAPRYEPRSSRFGLPDTNPSTPPVAAAPPVDVAVRTAPPVPESSSLMDSLPSFPSLPDAIAALPQMPSLPTFDSLMGVESPPVDSGFYYDAEENVIVMGDPVERDTLGQYMRVTVEAPHGASLYVDGENIGTAPVPDVLMAPGPHLFRTTYEDGRIIEQLVDVESGTGFIEF